MIAASLVALIGKPAGVTAEDSSIVTPEAARAALVLGESSSKFTPMTPLAKRSPSLAVTGMLIEVRFSPPPVGWSIG